MCDSTHLEALKAYKKNKGKRPKWFQDEHNNTFMHWLRANV